MIHHALSCKVKELVVDWMKIVSEVMSGLQHLHNKHKIWHNRHVLKSAPHTIVGAIIIDFGKSVRDNFAHSENSTESTTHTSPQIYGMDNV